MINTFRDNEYIEEEHKLYDANYNLFNEIKEHIKAIAKNDSLANEYLNDGLNFDGFYPYYTKQRFKILFIGKEGVGMSGCDYIQALNTDIKCNLIRGYRTVDQEDFFARQLYISYGLNFDQKNFIEYDKMEWASLIGTDYFANKNGISFSFINLSKFDNPGTYGFQADTKRINKYIKITKDEKFMQRQIELLNPDLIVTMNIFDFDKFYTDDEIEWKNNYTGYFIYNNRKYPIIDSYHFSSNPGHENFKTLFYHPILEAIKSFEELKNK